MAIMIPKAACQPRYITVVALVHHVHNQVFFLYLRSIHYCHMLVSSVIQNMTDVCINVHLIITYAITIVL